VQSRPALCKRAGLSFHRSQASSGEIRKFVGHSDDVTSVAFAPDGKTALSGSWDNTLRLWDLASSGEIRKFVGHSDDVTSVAFAPDGKTALSGSWDTTLRLWDLDSGREIRKFEGHSDRVSSVAISPDGKAALSGSRDGTIRLWDLQSGQQIVSLFASPDWEWLAITPKGFFTASQHDTDMLALVRGLEVTTIGQVHQSLYNPDLVREALAGDPNREVEKASKAINLDKVLDSGPAPQVEIVSHAPSSKSPNDLVTVAARIKNRGKDIGRIEWRLNGVTAGVMGAPARPGPGYEVRQELALDPGENRIEVIAYEGRNLLASLPAQTTIAYDGPADTAKPNLYILAIGINKYVDKGRSDKYSRLSQGPCRMPGRSAPRWKGPPRGNIRKSTLRWRSMRMLQRPNWTKLSTKSPAR
jgi:WD domain, G-beta repeat